MWIARGWWNMAAVETNGSQERVTMRTLNSKLEVAAANSRAEHWKTRLLVIALTLAANSKAVPLLLNYAGW